MHWFVWLLIILYSVNMGFFVARLGGYEPKPSSPWIGLILHALMLAGIIAYLT